MMMAAKIAGALLVLAAISGAVTWAANTIEKARGYEHALERVATVEREKVELATTFANAQAADVAIAGELATFRTELGKEFADFSQALSSRPITREVPRETVNGVPQPCIERDPIRYRELFNRAITGSGAAP